MTERFNKISYWVATEIVSIPQLEPRVQMLARFIQLAEVRVCESRMCTAMR
jgi:hypothetical protein